jgi:hypothetical protein
MYADGGCVGEGKTQQEAVANLRLRSEVFYNKAFIGAPY